MWSISIDAIRPSRALRGAMRGLGATKVVLACVGAKPGTAPGTARANTFLYHHGYLALLYQSCGCPKR